MAFTGTFDGNGHKITHFTINSTNNWYLGLFGQVNVTGSIKNLGLENFSVSGFLGVSGLAGCNNGGSISNCYSNGAVSGSYDVGGLVGYNSSGSSISNCYSIGAVSGSSGSYYVGGLVGGNGGNIRNSYSTGTVSGSSASRYVGGLVGWNEYSSISNCYSTSPVSGNQYVAGLVGWNYSGSISNCYSTGAVSGSSYTGGLVGYSDSGTANNSFWDVNTSGQTTSDGGTGKTTAQMKTLSTFTSASWDFTTPLWKICDGTNYPKLAWQKPLAGDFVCPDGTDVDDLAIFMDQWLLKKLSFDSNNDGIVNFRDFAVFANNWQGDMNQLAQFASQWLQRSATNADIAPVPTGDGIVNFLDFALFAENWLKQN
jgi:hypothetical protein